MQAPADPSAWKQLQAHLAEARACLNAGELDFALQHVDQALAIDPEYLAARVLRERIVRDKEQPLPAAIGSDARAPVGASAASAPLPDARQPLQERFARLEERARQRRIERRIEAARGAIVDGQLGTARAALEEARELDAERPELVDLEAALAQRERAAMSLPGRRGWAVALCAVALVVLCASWVERDPNAFRVARQQPHGDQPSLGAAAVIPTAGVIGILPDLSPPTFSDVAADLDMRSEVATAGAAISVPTSNPAPAGAADAAAADGAAADAVPDVAPATVSSAAASAVSGAADSSARASDRVRLDDAPAATQAISPAIFGAASRPAGLLPPPEPAPSVSAPPPAAIAPPIPLPVPQGTASPAPPATSRAGVATSHAGVPTPGTRAVAPEPLGSSAPVVSDERLVRDVLQRYRAAYDELNAASAQAVWPEVDEAALARAFAELSSQTLTFDNCAVELHGVLATAVCRGSARYTPKEGNRDPRSEPRVWNFTLRKVESGWQIDSARVAR